MQNPDKRRATILARRASGTGMTPPPEMPKPMSPMPSRASLWWHLPRPDAAAPLRLWCFPFAGGGAAVWHAMAGALAGGAEVRAARLPGRETRHAEAPCPRLADLVAALSADIAAEAHQPYALWGHSFGALLAFEVTRCLRALRAPAPAALIVSGARAPHLPPPQPLLHPMNPRDFVAELERRYGAIPDEIRAHPEFVALLLPPLRADMEAYETHRVLPAPPLAVPVLALGGEQDRMVSRADVLAWRAHTADIFEADFFSGGHFFPQEQLADVARRVRRFLAEV